MFYKMKLFDKKKVFILKDWNKMSNKSLKIILGSYQIEIAKYKL